jgi:hypothetical protein
MAKVTASTWYTNSCVAVMEAGKPAFSRMPRA